MCCNRCLAADNVVLQALGKSVPFEIAVGVNGRVWVNTGSVDHTILVSNCIINSEHMTPSQVRLMVQELLERTKSWQ
jgi:exosome complex component RRP40